jgi:hypothetical protein
MRAGLADAARTELEALPPNLAEDAKAGRLRTQLEFADALKNAPDLATLRARIAKDPADYEARDLLGVRLLVEGDAAAGLDEFLHILQKQRGWNDGQAKKRLIAAFAARRQDRRHLPAQDGVAVVLSGRAHARLRHQLTDGHRRLRSAAERHRVQHGLRGLPAPVVLMSRTSA